VDVFRDCVMDPRRHTADEHGNILVGIEISPEDPQRTEDREESSQEQNLEDLRDVTVAAAGALAFACFEREFWRGQRELAGALGGDHPDAAVHALSLMRAAKRLESWPPSDLAGLVRFLVHRQGGVGMELARVLHACGAHVLDAYLHESAWLDAKQDSDVVPAADMPETEHTLELVARFLSGEGLALLDGDAVVEPIGSDALQTVFCRIFEQAPEIPQIVWREEAPNWVHRLARPDER
jgi:hypothetical protein